MMRMLDIGIAAALFAAVLVPGISTGEAADKVKAGRTSTKSDPDSPVIHGTVPNPKPTKGGKIGGLKMEQDVIEQRSQKLKAKGKDGTKGKGGYNFSHRLYR